MVSLTDDANGGDDPLEREVTGLADRLDPVPQSVVEAARAAFEARDIQLTDDEVEDSSVPADPVLHTGR